MSLILYKSNNQNVRISELEKSVENANLTEILTQIEQFDASVKWAHHPIDELKKINK